jgi:hypothetical protein
VLANEGRKLGLDRAERLYVLASDLDQALESLTTGDVVGGLLDDVLPAANGSAALLWRPRGVDLLRAYLENPGHAEERR